MSQEDTSQKQVQALRSVNKNPPLDSVAPINPSEIIHVETTFDSDTQRQVVLWDEILQAYDNAIQVRHKSKVIPFLKGKDLIVLEPRRIAAVSDTVLDVVVDNQVANREAVAPQDRQRRRFPVPPQFRWIQWVAGEVSKL